MYILDLHVDLVRRTSHRKAATDRRTDDKGLSADIVDLLRVVHAAVLPVHM